MQSAASVHLQDVICISLQTLLFLNSDLNKSFAAVEWHAFQDTESIAALK